jgi:molybdopterin converting factor subunit 1
MRVRVLTFGVLRERLGGSEETVELKEGSTASELIEILRGRTSNPSRGSGADEGLWRSLAVAVNREYASREIILREGDEVALLPPVSGGLLRVGRKASFARAGNGVRERHGD